MSEVTVTLELPRAFVPLTGKSEKDLPLELKKLLALELVRRGTLTYSRAAELIGISQAEFVQYLAEHGESIFQYTEDELKEELALRDEMDKLRSRGTWIHQGLYDHVLDLLGEA